MLEVGGFMDGDSFDLQRRVVGQVNSLPGRVIRQRRVHVRTLAARAPTEASPAKILDVVVPEAGLNGRCESAVGRRNTLPRERAIHISGSFVKRIIDVALSGIALLFLWPLLLVIAVAVKLESRGPAIYRSLRAGKKGQKFSCYKFRTMVDGADELKDSLRRFNERRDPFFKIADCPRVTRLGRFLRKYSLDELPQFWNVLKGDMSLVGPRPHPVDDCARYRPAEHRRLEVKPGITGLWQVIARTDPSFETCMKLDLEYMKRWSLSLDCKILLRTVPAVVAGEGS